LVLVAISGLVQALVSRQVDKEAKAAKLKAKDQARLESESAQRIKATSLLPDVCPSCGAPVTPENVRWRGQAKASCSFCNSSVPLTEKAAT